MNIKGLEIHARRRYLATAAGTLVFAADRIMAGPEHPVDATVFGQALLHGCQKYLN